jgi:hypothetical protein
MKFGFNDKQRENTGKFFLDLSKGILLAIFVKGLSSGLSLKEIILWSLFSFLNYIFGIYFLKERNKNG